ncbi:GntR family transcriptional regulator [Brucellaceae bacterium C25G]
MSDFLSPMPIYRAVAKQIADRIESGEWATGTILPSEVALAQEFRVSVGTVRRALSDLTGEGLLARRRKTGTVVTGRTPQHNLRFYFDYFRLHSREGAMQNSVAKVYQVKLRPSLKAEADNLNIETGDNVIEISRIREVQDRPVMHETVVINAAIAPDFPLNVEAIPERIYPALWELCGLKIAAIRERIAAELATSEDCRLLNLNSPAAVLVIHEIAYDEQAQPILLNHHRATTENDIYINEIQ